MAAVIGNVVTLTDPRVPRAVRFTPTLSTWTELQFVAVARRAGPTRVLVFIDGSASGFVAFGGVAAGDALDTTPGTGDDYAIVPPGQWVGFDIDPETNTELFFATQPGVCEICVVLDRTERRRSRP